MRAALFLPWLTVLVVSGAVACEPEIYPDCLPENVRDAQSQLLQALQRGELDAAGEALQMLQTQVQATQPAELLLLRQAQGEYHFHRGQMTLSAQAFSGAHALAEQLGLADLAHDLQIDEAIARRDAGELWAALQQFEAVRAIRPPSYRLDANLATLYAQLGAPDLAAALLTPYGRQGQEDRSDVRSEPSRRLAVRVSSTPVISVADAADAQVRLAQLQLDLGRPDQALELLADRYCVELPCRSEQNPALLDWWELELVAEATRLQGQLERSERLYSQLAERLPAGPDQAFADFGLAKVAVDAGDWSGARQHLHRLHSRPAEAELRWAAWALQLCSPVGAERSSAQRQLEAALPELLVSTDPARVPEYRLRRRLQTLEALLEQWLRRGGTADLLAAFELLPQLQQLSPGVAATPPNEGRGGQRQGGGSAAIIERRLGAQEMIRARAANPLVPSRPEAATQAAETASAIWLIHEQTALLRIGDRLWQMPVQLRETDLVNHVDLLVAGDPAWRVTGARLYQQLGGALLDRACAESPETASACGPGADLVIRSGPLLADFPFASLLDGHGKLLLQRHALRIDDRVVGAPRLTGDRALVVAHSGADFRGRGPWWQRLGLPTLSEVPREGSEIASNWPARVLLAEQAAHLPAVQRALQQRPNVLHVAAHAVLNPWRPQRSGLLLAAAENGNPWWEAGAIAASRIEADLVVLAACQSARRSTPWRGGLGGLADSFIRAGAGSVIGSLWSVEDRQTRWLMRELYRRLPEQPVAQALRSAQLAAIDAGQAPGSWAAWVLRD